jgi:hypothetical protein
MSQINVGIDNNTNVPILTASWLPPGAKIYQYALVDEANTAAAKNFISHMNPAGSGKTMSPLGLVVDSHTIGATNIGSSLSLQRISAASAGTLVAASTLTKFDPAQADSASEIRNTNPTVTRTGLALIGIGPVIVTAGGGNVPSLVAPFGIPPIIPPGTGIVFGTATGDVDQLWNIQYTWMEY